MTNTRFVRFGTSPNALLSGRGPTMSDRTAVILLACALTLLVAALVGAAAGCLARRDHATYPTALTHAAIAFTSTLTLAAAITAALAALAN